MKKRKADYATQTQEMFDRIQSDHVFTPELVGQLVRSWQAITKKGERFGQWLCNNGYVYSPCPRVYYCADKDEVIRMIQRP